LNRTALAFIIIRHFGQFLLIVTVMQSDSTCTVCPLFAMLQMVMTIIKDSESKEEILKKPEALLDK